MKTYTFSQNSFMPAYWGVERTLSDVLDEMQTLWQGGSGQQASYKLDEHDDSYSFSLDVPGVREKDLDIQLNGDTLSITGKRGDKNFIHKMLLPKDVDMEKTEAKLQDGVLTIQLGKNEKAKPRKILISGVQEDKNLIS